MPLFSEKGSATILEPLPFAEWQQRPAWPAVSLANTDPVEDLAPHVGRLRLIVLNFPKFSDGRAYSQAYLLRRRRKFAGDIRATGDVLIDQLVQMQRTGFSSAVLKEGKDIADAQRQFDRYAAYYQGDVQTRPHFARAG
jgi:uncharacterized protein (DUF934 family)